MGFLDITKARNLEKFNLEQSPEGTMAGLELRSGSFGDGGEIPRRFGYKQGNHSPQLVISGVPQGTASLALVMDDPDAVGAVGKVWLHWLVWDIPPDGEFGEDSVPQGCAEGRNDFGEDGYGGPAPPDKEHTYVFKLYALSGKVGARPGSARQEVEQAIKGMVIEEAVLRGRFAP